MWMEPTTEAWNPKVTQWTSGPTKAFSWFTWFAGQNYKPPCESENVLSTQESSKKSALVGLLSTADWSTGKWDVNYKALLSEWFMIVSALLIMLHWLSHKADWRNTCPHSEKRLITPFILSSGQQHYQYWWLFVINRAWMKDDHT